MTLQCSMNERFLIAALVLIIFMAWPPFPGHCGTATGDGAVASGFGSTATGENSQATGTYSAATGAYSQATGSYSTATGGISEATGNHSTATGAYSRAVGNCSTATGNGSQATSGYSTATGAHSQALGDNSVALGAYSIADQADTVSVGDSTGLGLQGDFTRRIVNVGAGIDANDAATKGQMDAGDAALQAQVDTHTSQIATLRAGGSIASATNGSSDPPDAAATSGYGSTAMGSGASARDRDTAIGYQSIVTADGSVAVGADSRVDSANSVAVGADSRVGASAPGGIAMGQNASVEPGAAGSVAIGRNSVADQADTVSVGSSSHKRRITNVADAVGPNDAVNLSQMNRETDRLDDRIDDVGALSSAFSALVPLPKTAGATQVSIGIGSYKSSQAAAIGVFRYVNDKIILNAGVSTAFDKEETAVRGGVTFAW